jgi:hypothetical protein
VHLVAVRGVDDSEGAHDARIAGKHLRYLIEPLRKERPEAERLLARLRTLQDLLGEMNDLHLVEETLNEETARLARAGARRLRRLADSAAPEGEPARDRRRLEVLGIEALSTIARARRAVLYGELRHAWLSGRSRDFFKDVELLAEALVAKPWDDSQLAMDLALPDEQAPVVAPEVEPTAQSKEPGGSHDRAVIPLRAQQKRSNASRRRSAS